MPDRDTDWTAATDDTLDDEAAALAEEIDDLTTDREDIRAMVDVCRPFDPSTIANVGGALLGAVTAFAWVAYIAAAGATPARVTAMVVSSAALGGGAAWLMRAVYRSAARTAVEIVDRRTAARNELNTLRAEQRRRALLGDVAAGRLTDADGELLHHEGVSGACVAGNHDACNGEFRCFGCRAAVPCECGHHSSTRLVRATPREAT